MEFINLMDLFSRENPKPAIPPKEILIENLKALPIKYQILSQNSVGHCGFIFWKCIPNENFLVKINIIYFVI